MNYDVITLPILVCYRKRTFLQALGSLHHALMKDIPGSRAWHELWAAFANVPLNSRDPEIR